MMTEDGAVLLFVQMPDDLEERQWRVGLVRSYMLVKMVRSFVMATELMQPDASVVMGVARGGAEAGLQMITRSPLSFGETLWLGQEEIDEEIVSLLPPRDAMATLDDVEAVEDLIRHNEGIVLEGL
ncbi:MAG: hypothetical protein ACR2PI_17415 [Hyphomicrobiaceae bacterium]